MEKELKKLIEERIEEVRDLKKGTYEDTTYYDLQEDRLVQLKEDLFGRWS